MVVQPKTVMVPGLVTEQVEAGLVVVVETEILAVAVQEGAVTQETQAAVPEGVVVAVPVVGLVVGQVGDLKVPQDHFVVVTLR